MAGVPVEVGVDEERGKTLRREANLQFKANNYELALETYSKTVPLDLSTALALSIHINMAIASSKLEKYEECRQYAMRCIELDATAVRGYFWKAMSEIYLRSFQDAKSTFEQGLEIDPANKDIPKRLTFLDFCIANSELISNFPQKDWLNIEDAINYNLRYASKEKFAKEMTKMTKRKKDDKVVCISSGVCNFFGKIVSMEIPTHAFSQEQKDINWKIKCGEYHKIYTQVLISLTPDGSRSYEYKVHSEGEGDKFNEFQVYAFQSLEKTAHTPSGTPYNPYFHQILFESSSPEGATPN